MHKPIRSIGTDICSGLAILFFIATIYFVVFVPAAQSGVSSGDESYNSIPSAVVTHSRTLYDRIHREFFVLFKVTNTGSDPIVGPARMLIKDSSLDVLNADGTTPDGTPYFEILSPEQQLPPGEVIGPIRVNFALQRARLTFESYVESAQTQEEDVWVCYSTDLGCDFNGVMTIEFRDQITDTIYTLDVDTYNPGHYCITIPQGAYWIDAFGESFSANVWDSVTISNEYDPECTPQEPNWDWNALCSITEYGMEACSFGEGSECCVGPYSETEYYPWLITGVGTGDPNYDGVEDRVLYLFFSDCYSMIDQCGEGSYTESW